MNLKRDLSNKFNPKTWNGWKVWKLYKHTGFNLIDEINSLDPDLVIDVGCGHNRFKGHIKNLIGFDQEPFPFVDIVANIEDINFRKESADVVLVLGSIQFGNRDLVQKHFSKVVEWVKPGGYIVMRTITETELTYSYKEIHYVWTLDDIYDIGNKNNLEVYKGPFIENAGATTRNAWWYKKPGNLSKYKINPFNCEITER